MPVSSTTTSYAIQEYLNKVIYNYRYLGLVLNSIYFSADIPTASNVVTLKYKDGRYEMISIDNIEDIKRILDDKNLALQPKRGERASKYHI